MCALEKTREHERATREQEQATREHERATQEHCNECYVHELFARAYVKFKSSSTVLLNKQWHAS